VSEREYSPDAKLAAGRKRAKSAETVAAEPVPAAT
jgi:hypothetical protein